MVSFRSIHLPFSNLPRPPLARYLFTQISSKFSTFRKMGVTENINNSSQAQGSSTGGNPAICKDSVIKNRKSFHTSHDNEKFITVGDIRCPQHHCAQGTSLTFSTRRGSSLGNQRDFRSVSDPIPSQPTTTHSEQLHFSKGTRVDLCTDQSSVDPYGESCCRSHSGHCSFSRKDLSSHQVEPSQPSQMRKKMKPACANKPHSSYSNSICTPAGQRLETSASLSMFERYDICQRGRGNSVAMGASPHAKTEESCTVMRERGNKQWILRPGMVILKHYITDNEQVEIVRICRELGMGPGGFYQPGYKDGAKLRLQMMCLGMDWDPQTRKYGNRRAIDGSEPPKIPHKFSLLVKRAIKEAHSLIKVESGLGKVEDVLPSMSPDICIVNFYTTNGRLGLHQDRDESRESLRKRLPVVSFSIGDSAEFLYGDQRDVEKAEKVLLESGDVLIFGGKSRNVFHGVSSIIPNSAPKQLLRDTSLRSGRLNLTFRQF